MLSKLRPFSPHTTIYVSSCRIYDHAVKVEAKSGCVSTGKEGSKSGCVARHSEAAFCTPEFKDHRFALDVKANCSCVSIKQVP
jgi:hypothetical protein